MFNEKQSAKDSFTRLKTGAKGLVVSIVLMLAMVYIVSLVTPEKKVDEAFPPSPTPDVIKFREGDIIFQRSSGELADKIAAITKSELTHCGIVVIENEKVMVLEAGDTVSLKPVKEWVKRGEGKKFLLMRAKNIKPGQVTAIIEESRKYYDKPYDFKYSWDDDFIYCSELVYKCYKRGSGIELCPFIALKDLDYKGHEEYIKKLMNGKLPLDLEMITPVGISRSGELKVIYNDFKN